MEALFSSFSGREVESTIFQALLCSRWEKLSLRKVFAELSGSGYFIDFFTDWEVNSWQFHKARYNFDSYIHSRKKCRYCIYKRNKSGEQKLWKMTSTCVWSIKNVSSTVRIISIYTRLPYIPLLDNSSLIKILRLRNCYRVEYNATPWLYNTERKSRQASKESELRFIFQAMTGVRFQAPYTRLRSFDRQIRRYRYTPHEERTDITHWTKAAA